MRICVVDTNLPLSRQDSGGMAKKCVEWQLSRNGLLIEKNPDNADIVFMTSTFPTSARYGVKIKNKPVFSGGSGCLSPVEYLKYSEFVVIGDGENVIRHISEKGIGGVEYLANVLVDGKTEVSVNNNFPWDCPPIQQEDGSFSIWCGRGCKKFCLFCQTGWALKYSENPNDPSGIARILKENGEKISYLSNDVLAHSFFPSLPRVAHGSYTLAQIGKIGIPKSKYVRIGVEGVSERLRKFVGKPIKSDELINATAWLNNNGKTVRWFMIAGLPTEKKSDWDELKETVQGWKWGSEKNALELSFTAWCPMPATPLCIFPLTDDYYENWTDFENWFFKGIGFHNRIKLYGPKKPENRLLEAMSSMAMSESELRKGGNLGPNKVVKYPYDRQRMMKIQLFGEK